MPIALSFQDTIALLNLGDDENRFSPEFLDQFDAHLDDAVRDGVRGLVTTATGKFYSNGLDLDWLAAHGDQTQWYVGRVQALLARVLTLPIPTAAALNGHSFGAAAMLAMAHDFRVMRADRGYFCFPEVDIRIPFTPGLAALIQAKLTPQAAVSAMTTGTRFGGPDAAAIRIVDAAAEAGRSQSGSTALAALRRSPRCALRRHSRCRAPLRDGLPGRPSRRRRDR